MTLTGGFAALSCLHGSAVTATNVNLINSSRGVLAFHHGSCVLNDSTIDNNNQGLTIGANSNVWLRGVNVTNSNTAANVYTNSTLTLDSSPTTGGKTIVSGGARGLSVFSNASIRPNHAIIENTAGIGINIFAGGSMFIESDADVEVRNNGSHGIIVQKLTNAYLSSGLSITNNGGAGLACNEPHSIYQNGPPHVSGNAMGDINGNCEIYP